MLTEIINSGLQTDGVVLEKAQSYITRTAQQSSYLTSNMTMIQGYLTRSFKFWDEFLTNSAFIVLIRKNLFALFSSTLHNRSLECSIAFGASAFVTFVGDIFSVVCGII